MSQPRSCKLWLRRQPKISIHLNGQKQGCTNSYTTSDKVDGTATITTDDDSQIDHVEITLEGTARVSLDRAPSIPQGRQLAVSRTFLKLRHPVLKSERATACALNERQDITIPFTFTIPNRLLPETCDHPVEDDDTHRRHTHLPPTLTHSKPIVDDLSPTMCQIAYCVKVTVFKHGRVKPVATRTRTISIVPTDSDKPTFDFGGKELDIHFGKEKAIHRGVTKQKVGRLSMTVSNPEPIRIPLPERKPSEGVSSAVQLNLRFDPVGDDSPPCLGSLESKLRASTFYTDKAWTKAPQLDKVGCARVGTGVFERTLPLSSLCISSVNWVKHFVQDGKGGDFDAGMSHSVYYTARLVIPVTLPKDKVFVPSFESCFIARTYALAVRLSYRTSNTLAWPGSIQLQAPLQITASGYEDGTKRDAYSIAGSMESAFLPPYEK